MIDIRQLGAADSAGLRAMNTLFATVFGDAESYAAKPPGDAWLQRLLAGNAFIALVAERDGVVVGSLAAYVLEKFEQERSEVYIYDLAVAEAHQRQGIATALIRTLQAIASERGAWVIFVQADYGDDPAVALYTGLGAREDVMHFDIPVRRISR